MLQRNDMNNQQYIEQIVNGTPEIYMDRAKRGSNFNRRSQSLQQTSSNFNQQLLIKNYLQKNIDVKEQLEKLKNDLEVKYPDPVKRSTIIDDKDGKLKDQKGLKPSKDSPAKLPTEKRPQSPPKNEIKQDEASAQSQLIELIKEAQSSKKKIEVEITSNMDESEQ